MFCKSCGHEIDGDSKYCSFCGAKQSEINIPPLPDFSPPEHKKIQELEPPSQLPQPVASTSALEFETPLLPKSKHITASNQESSPINLLDDIHPVDILGRRPKTVSISLFLQVAILIEGLAAIIIGMVNHTISDGQLVITFFFTLWRGLLTNSIFLRKKRARDTYCVLALLRIVILIMILTGAKNLDEFEGIEFVGTGIIESSTIILLFSKSARKWFNAKPEDMV